MTSSSLQPFRFSDWDICQPLLLTYLLCPASQSLPTFPKDLIYFWKFSTTPGTSHLGAEETKFGSLIKLWIKGNSQFEMNQHEVLKKSNQTSRGFYFEDYILANVTTSNTGTRKAPIKTRWGGWCLTGAQTEKRGPFSGSCGFLLSSQKLKSRNFCSASIHFEKWDLIFVVLFTCPRLICFRWVLRICNWKQTSLSFS